jgi:lipoprotein-releasing system ATP-binding protein
MAELIVDNINKEYPTRSEPLHVLRDVSFSLGSGQSAAILGPSGCGKSTLLQILGTLQRPTSGKIQLDGLDPFALGEIGLADFRNQQVGFIFQDHHLLPQLSAIENVLVPAIAKGKPTRQQVKRAKDLLDRVGLSDRSDHRPSELSGGERQRISTARALINQPSLLLADEPTGNLERSNAHQIADLLKSVQAHDETKPIMIVVTHSTELSKRFDHQWHLDDGCLSTGTA